MGEYASYCARIHDEEIYHDLCVVKNSVLDLPPVQPPAFNTVRYGSPFIFGFVFFARFRWLGGGAVPDSMDTLIQGVWEELVISSKHNHGKWLLIAWMVSSISLLFKNRVSIL